MVEHGIVIPPHNADDQEFDSLLAQCGRPFGVGTNRDAYAIPSHEDKVLKVSKVPSHVNNWAEAVIYYYVTDKQFFAEVYSWSQSGKYLVVEYLDNVIGSISGLEVPDWWTDRKLSNLGRSRKTGDLKIRDYAMLNIRPGVLFRFP